MAITTALILYVAASATGAFTLAAEMINRLPKKLRDLLLFATILMWMVGTIFVVVALQFRAHNRF